MESGRENRLNDPTPTGIPTVAPPTEPVVRIHAREEVRNFNSKGTIMSTDSGISAGLHQLALFDGYPYLITRVVAGLYHIILLPAGLRHERYHDLLRDQSEANRLPIQLVCDESTAWPWDPETNSRQQCEPPRGGIIVKERLQASIVFDETPEILARRVRLEEFERAHKREGYILGDMRKGGRRSTEEERGRLNSRDENGVPKGLEMCKQCGQPRGECLDLTVELASLVVRVHCVCENDNRCARCGLPLDQHKLNANHLEPNDGRIWYTPGFSAFSHRCPSNDGPRSADERRESPS